MRTGKIARLPHDIREQLNRRLSDGEQAHSTLNWRQPFSTRRSRKYCENFTCWQNEPPCPPGGLRSLPQLARNRYHPLRFGNGSV